MGQIRTGHFIANGSAVNLNLGFVPSYIRVTNLMAADTEVAVIERFKEMAAGVEIWWNNSDTGEQNFVYKSSGGYIAEYDANVIGNRKSVVFDETGGTYDDMCTVAAGHGFVEGERVKLVASGGLPTGFNERTIYYVKYKTPTIFQLSLTNGGAAVAITGDGTAPNYVYSVDNLEIDAVGGKGVTIAAAFMDDSDIIYYVAMEADRDVDHGDAADYLTL